MSEGTKPSPSEIARLHQIIDFWASRVDLYESLVADKDKRIAELCHENAELMTKLGERTSARVETNTGLIGESDPISKEPIW